MTTIKNKIAKANNPINTSANSKNISYTEPTCEVDPNELMDEIIRLHKAKMRLKNKEVVPYMFSSFMICLGTLVFV